MKLRHCSRRETHWRIRESISRRILKRKWLRKKNSNRRWLKNKQSSLNRNSPMNLARHSIKRKRKNMIKKWRNSLKSTRISLCYLVKLRTSPVLRRSRSINCDFSNSTRASPANQKRKRITTSNIIISRMSKDRLRRLLISWRHSRRIT